MRRLALKDIIALNELKDLFLAIVVLGFAFSFRDWGTNYFDAELGFSNFLLSTFLVAITFLVHEIVHRWAAVHYGAKITFKTWKFLLLATIVVVFITNGWFVFAAIGAVSIRSLHYYRAGYKKPHLGPYERAKIAVSGPLANLGLAILASAMIAQGGSILWNDLLRINIWIALFNLFPFFRLIPAWMTYTATKSSRLARRAAYRYFKEDIPYIEGELAFYGSRPLWIFTFIFAVVTSFLLYYYGGVWISIILAFLLAFITYMLWHFFVEPWSYKVSRSARRPHS